MQLASHGFDGRRPRLRSDVSLWDVVSTDEDEDEELAGEETEDDDIRDNDVVNAAHGRGTHHQHQHNQNFKSSSLPHRWRLGEDVPYYGNCVGSRRRPDPTTLMQHPAVPPLPSSAIQSIDQDVAGRLTLTPTSTAISATTAITNTDDDSITCKSIGFGANVNPNEFRQRRDVVVRWFQEFDDEQKNILLKELMKSCGAPQNHVLSVAIEPVMHDQCPPNCQDFLTWLPKPLSLYILCFLDPISLARCAEVCRAWYALANHEFLWRKLCATPQWQLSNVAEDRQLGRCRLPDGGAVLWKKAFSERFRLWRNWTKGYCHVRTFEGHTQGISCVQFDDTRIVSGSSDKTIKVWNIRTNSRWSVMTLVGHSGTVRCLHLEGNRLVSGSTDCTIKVWDLSSNSGWSSIACKVTMIGHRDTVRCLQVDDQKVVSGSYDRTLKVWDIRTGDCKLTLRGHEGAVLCVQHDKTKIVSGSCDRTIKIWNFVPGVCMNTLSGHQDAVTCLQYDAQRIISGSLDRTIKFWNLLTGQCLGTLDWMKSEGHTGVIRCLQADQWRIVSAGDDKTLKVWSLETGQRLVTLKNHTDGVTCLQFNDHVIVSGSYDKTVKLWDFSVC